MKIMAILNTNNESFYSGSRATTVESVAAKIDRMLSEGADIIDMGGCSTRPGSEPVSLEQEWEYLKGPLQYIKGARMNFTLSIDTFRSEIVRRAYDIVGDFIVNDISAGEDDPQMLQRVGELGLPYIAMHKRGTPATMGDMCSYPDGVVNEVIDYFRRFGQRAAEYGVNNYILDPGFGFAKNLEQNYELLRGIPQIKSAIEEFSGRRRELLVGISRKGMIWKPLGISPDESLTPTAALNLQALILGADILRVHDVKEAVQCVKLKKMLFSES